MNQNPNYPPRTPKRVPPAPGAGWQVPLESDTAYLGDPDQLVPPSRASGCVTWLKWGLALAVLLTIVVVVAGCGGYALMSADLPSADQLASVRLDQSTKIYDRNGGLLFEMFDQNSADAGRRTIVPPERLPLVLKQATIATEDPTFYSNSGVDPYAVLRAIYYDVRYQRTISGGSTITQQLVKKTLLSPEQTITRKIREAILAVEITRRYPKEQILAFYLNTIPYGNLSYGIQAASQSYFKKDVDKLDLAEASLLAGLPQAPALYDPCQDPDAALGRQRVVLDLMQKQSFIDGTQAEAAAQEMDQVLHSDDFGKRCTAPTRLSAPHFVTYVRQLLEQQYGTEVVYNGGLQVYTTLDPTMQKIAEEEIAKQVTALKKNNVTDGALVATDPKTGQILAMVGSADFYDKTIDGQVNVATSLRQPGSSIKPVNYVTALQKGWTPATPLIDISTQFPNGSQPPYVPVNYDGKDHGLVNVRTALANSYNIPAVKTLYFVGVKDMIATAEKMGITTFQNPNRYGLALTLGGGEVRLTELTEAYAVFANQGQSVCMTPYLKILDGQGKPVDLSQECPQSQKVLDPRHAYLITNILSDNAARTPAFGPNSPLKLTRAAAAKTGTTNDYKDNWTIGYTPELVVGVWVGNARNTAMKGVSGITGAAPIWHNVMERVYAEDDQYKKIGAHAFSIPPGLVQAVVCNESGLLPTENCPADHRHTEIFLDSQAPNKPDDVWVKLKIDKSNNQLANDQCPPDQVEDKVFERIPHDLGDLIPYDQLVKWANDHGIPQPPTQQSPCTNQPTPEPTAEPTQVDEVQINNPHDGQTVRGTVRVGGIADIPNFAGYTVEVGHDNQWIQIGTGTSPVNRNTLAQFDTRLVQDGPYIIRLTVLDTGGNSRQDQVQVTVDNQVETATPEPTKPPKPTRTPTPEPGSAVGPGTYENTSPAIVYVGTWQRGGGTSRSNQANASASLTVIGATSFSIVTTVGPNRGIARVLVDGGVIATFDGHSPTVGSATEGPYPLPDQGQHTIMLQVTGTKSPDSNNTYVFLDKIIVSGSAMSFVVPAQTMNEPVAWNRNES